MNIRKTNPPLTHVFKITFCTSATVNLFVDTRIKGKNKTLIRITKYILFQEGV